MAGDRLKSVTTIRFCNRIKVAVRDNGPDPKLNTQLDRLIVDAMQNYVSKDTILRTIQRAIDKPIKTVFLEYKGPGGSFLILDCLTDTSQNSMTNFVNGRMKKVPGGFEVKEKQARPYFEHVGLIRLLKDSTPPEHQDEESTKKAWNSGPTIQYPPPLSFEDAETLAIELNALSVHEITDLEGRPAYELLCEPAHVQRIEKELTTKHYSVVGSGQEFRPLCKVKLSEQHMKYIDQFYDVIDSLEEIQNVFDNIAFPANEQD